MEVELQALRQRNEELLHSLQEQENINATKGLRTDRRSRAQTQEFANLTAELWAGRKGPKVQFEGMRLGIKIEKPDTYNGDKGRNLDTWLFQVCEHLGLPTIPNRGHILYAVLLLHSNATLWWHKVCEGHHRPAMWEDFCRLLCD